MVKINLDVLKKYSIVLILLVLMGIFAMTNKMFLSGRNLLNIVTQNTYFIIAAVGLSFVMIGGGIDLSVGWQMSLVGGVVAIMMVVYTLPPWAAILIGLLVGASLGFLNGLIVTNVRVFPLIVTIATGTVFQGVSYIVFQGRTFKPFPETFRFLTQGKLVGIPFDVFLMIVIVLLAIFVYSKTTFGWNVLAVGGNEEAARLAGIKTKAIRIAVYTICGAIFALATMIMMSKANSHSVLMGPGTEFTCLTAAIIGGISFMGGEGNMLGLVIGVFVLAVLGNGMQLAGWGTYYQYIVKGLILLGAVTFDELQKTGMLKRIKNLTGIALAIGGGLITLIGFITTWLKSLAGSFYSTANASGLKISLDLGIHGQWQQAPLQTFLWIVLLLIPLAACFSGFVLVRRKSLRLVALAAAAIGLVVMACITIYAGTLLKGSVFELGIGYYLCWIGLAMELAGGIVSVFHQEKVQAPTFRQGMQK